jgi:N-acetylglutamate synthase-like GNAT family acetyltransferase
VADHPLPDGVVLRPATAADLTAVRVLLRDAKLPADGVEDQFGEPFVVGVRREGRIVGVAGLEVYGSEGLLRSLVVVPPLRGLGLGEALTHDRLARARALQLSAVWLLTTTAAGFFDQIGFTRVERTSAPPELQASPEFKTLCPGTAVCLHLALR